MFKTLVRIDDFMMKHVIGSTFTVVIILVFLYFGFIIYLGVDLHRQDIARCTSAWKDSSVESRWVDDIGCQVKTNDGWIPADNYNATAPGVLK